MVRFVCSLHGQCCKFVVAKVCVIGSSVRRREQPENEAVQFDRRINLAAGLDRHPRSLLGHQIAENYILGGYLLQRLVDSV